MYQSAATAPALPGFSRWLPPELPYSPQHAVFASCRMLTRTGGQLYTWHLSVVDAGYPRGIVRRRGRAASRRCSQTTTCHGTTSHGRRRVDAADGSSGQRPVDAQAAVRHEGRHPDRRRLQRRRHVRSRRLQGRRVVHRPQRQRRLGRRRPVGQAGPPRRPAGHRRLGRRRQDRHRHLRPGLARRSAGHRATSRACPTRTTPTRACARTCPARAERIAPWRSHAEADRATASRART